MCSVNYYFIKCILNFFTCPDPGLGVGEAKLNTINLGAHSVLERQRGQIHYQTEGYMLYFYTDDAVGAMSRGHLLPCVAERGSAEG